MSSKKRGKKGSQKKKEETGDKSPSEVNIQMSGFDKPTSRDGERAESDSENDESSESTSESSYMTTSSESSSSKVPRKVNRGSTSGETPQTSTTGRGGGIGGGDTTGDGDDDLAGNGGDAGDGVNDPLVQKDGRKKKKRKKKKNGGLPTSSGEPDTHVSSHGIGYSHKCAMHISFILSILILLILFGALAPQIQRDMRKMIDWIQFYDEILGMITLFFAIFNAIVLLASSADVTLLMGCGFCYGTLGGTLFAWLATFIGSLFAKLIARLILRQEMNEFLRKFETYRLIDRCIKDYGLILVISLRICPFIPFGLSSYLIALTGISLTQFSFGHIAALPGCFLLALVGKLKTRVSQLKPHAYSENPWTKDLGLVLFVSYGVLFSLSLLLIYRRYSILYKLSSLSQTEYSRSDREGGEGGGGPVRHAFDDDSEMSDDSYGGGGGVAAGGGVKYSKYTADGFAAAADDGGSKKRRKKKKKRRKRTGMDDDDDDAESSSGDGNASGSDDGGGFLSRATTSVRSTISNRWNSLRKSTRRKQTARSVSDTGDDGIPREEVGISM